MKFDCGLNCLSNWNCGLSIDKLYKSQCINSQDVMYK